MCLPIEVGGIGFDYRLAMGLPDMWTNLTKTRDEDWNMWSIYHELTSRRPLEKYISYTESHDQALVGDKTMIFRLADAKMYTDMANNIHNPVIDRAIAVHKMARLLTLVSGGEGYLNFMGNEFGHPEWIDFPREGNDWSYHYCRRQWSLQENPFLKYQGLSAFDCDMLKTVEKARIYDDENPTFISMNEEHKTLVFSRNGLIFAFNFHPTNAFEVHIPSDKAGSYSVLLSSDDEKYGGFNRIPNAKTKKVSWNLRKHLCFTIPSLSAIVLRKIR
jgi:1,4-alpha-glucan branching enzyme